MKNLIFQPVIILLTPFFIILFLASNAAAAGVLDPTFGTNGKVSTSMGGNAQASAVVVQPDGKIIVAGIVFNGATSSDAALIRLNPNGTLDTSFGTGGKVVKAFSNGQESIYAVALQPDGKIVIAGEFYSATTSSVDFLLARFTSSGSIDTSFGNGGVASVNQGSFDRFYSVVVQPDGKIVASGFTSDGSRAAVIRFNSNGTLDGGFAQGGLFYLTVPDINGAGFSELVLYPNGRIAAGGQGSSSSPGSNVKIVIAMLQPNGSLAPDFGNQGVLTINEFAPGIISLGFDMLLTPDNKLLTVSAQTRRILSNGALDPTFNPATFGIESHGSHLAIRGDGKFFTVRFDPEFDTVIRDGSGRFIGKAKGFAGSGAAVQSDNKLILINSTGANFIVTRLSAITSQANRSADVNRDERSDFGVYDASSSAPNFRFLNSDNSQFSLMLPTTRVIPEYGLFRDANGNFQNSIIHWRRGVPTVSGSQYAEVPITGGFGLEFPWGLPEDIPTGGDFNGDVITDMTVFRPSNGVWYSARSDNNTYSIVQWGISGDKPVPADYDYDGKTDYAVYRPSTGTWWIRKSSDGAAIVVRFGLSTDIPLTGDYDGDGRADFTVYRPSEGNWYHFLTTEGFRVIRFGLSTDVPVPGDYDGDGKHDQAIFRNGLWYLLQSTEGFKVVQWGNSNDSPVAIRYDQ
jgi:uncharacterized delta-60 repeat protein